MCPLSHRVQVGSVVRLYYKECEAFLCSEGSCEPSVFSEDGAHADVMCVCAATGGTAAATVRCSASLSSLSPPVRSRARQSICVCARP
jgi:hypothetical protein